MSFSSIGRITEKEEGGSFSLGKAGRKKRKRKDVRGFLKRNRKHSGRENNREKGLKFENKFLILKENTIFIQNCYFLFFLKCFAISSFGCYLKGRRTIE
ncbi:MAG: hypothetical protein PUA93_04645 [Eubacteriales bacterium]|nr:hypothetical protein [Eubacteriales bacterium]